MTALGVALAVGVMTTVSGIALGLASNTTVQSEDVDYWIVPEASGSSSIAVSVDGPKLGSVHSVADQLSRDERISYVTPIQLSVLQATAGNQTEYVLAVGVIPAEQNRTVAGLPTGGLHPGDPHYDNGTYNGTWTGEAVVSEAAGDLLGVTAGEQLQVGPTTARNFTVTQTTQGDLSSGIGPVPVVMVHLSELQTITGSANGDLADQFLVSTNAPGTRTELEGVYPQTRVIASGGLGAPEVSTESLPLAVAVAAAIAALLVGTLFVATLMGLEITADRGNIATLAALGMSVRSRLLLVTFETICISLIGGIVGIGIGYVGMLLVNYASRSAIGIGAIARFHPALIGFGIAVALLIGLLAAPYPVWISHRTNVLEVLNQ
jgi:putative ABC transport system permease protein